MIYVPFGVAVAAAIARASFLIVALERDDFEFWPPPRKGAWQESTFWGLFRVYCGATIVTAFVDPTNFGWEFWGRLLPGVALLAAGAVMTLYGYLFLGLDNTYGRRAGLVTDGMYAYSRNPQYIASVAATAGLALTLDSPLTLVLAAGLHGLYTLFALNEERWLFDRYGAPYLDYTRRVPRFLGIRSVARAYAELAGRL